MLSKNKLISKLKSNLKQHLNINRYRIISSNLSHLLYHFADIHSDTGNAIILNILTMPFIKTDIGLHSINVFTLLAISISIVLSMLGIIPKFLDVAIIYRNRTSGI